MTDTADNWYSEDSATLGDRLAAAREAAGLSQDELAEKLGVDIEALDAWENDRREPRANRLQMLTGLLGVSLRWLLTGIGEGPDDPGTLEQTPQDVHAILMEMRRVRTQMAQASVRLGELEKQLRQAWTAS